MSSVGLSAARTRRSVATQIGEPFEREVLAVERDEHRVGGDERVEREQAERRRRVDEDVVEAIAQWLEEVAQAALASRQRDELDFRAGEIAIGGNQPEMLDRGLEDEDGRVLDRVGGGQRLVDGAGGSGLPFEADAAGEVGLRVDVDEQDALVGHRQGCRQVDGGSGFGDAAFLVGDGDDAAHLVV